MAQFLEQAQQFFDLCETGKGWEACKPFCVEGAVFECDVLPMKSLEDYTNWMTAIANQVMPGAKYETISRTSNETQVVFCARFLGTNTGEGGPVAPTGKSTNCHYSYIIEFNADGKVTKMLKIWDQLTGFLQLGWPLPDKPQNVV